jgi:hypothetical protein
MSQMQLDFPQSNQVTSILDGKRTPSKYNNGNKDKSPLQRWWEESSEETPWHELGNLLREPEADCGILGSDCLLGEVARLKDLEVGQEVYNGSEKREKV